MAAKAKGYGMPGVRVDGNDALAVYAVVRDAVERARAGGGPSFVECLTYRLGAHTTSDDPTRYRDERVTERWKALDPLLRMRAYLDRRGLWGDADETALREATDREIRETWTAVEGTEPPELLSVFADVFAELTPQLQEQHDALLRRAAKAPFTTHG
jgi:TPP-dependent pyruvate/acetoin dehydrogenase alpha subunit